MRRLPIYFLIDISESMVGEPIQQVEEGLATIIQALKTDPHALETVYVSIIVFAGQPKTLVPLQEIVSFYPPRFPIGSGTSLSKGLGHLMFELRNNIVKTTYEVKGDWKPIVFLFTDGVPTDDTQAAINEWKNNWQRTANLIAVSFGNETDTKLLGQLTENVLHFKNTNVQSYKEFFKWVTDSIKTSSISVENNSSGFELAKLDGETLSKIDLTKEEPNKQYVDDNYVVLSGKCQNTKRPYLMKYRKNIAPSIYAGIELASKNYKLVGAYQVDNNYFELADTSNFNTKVNTEELFGAPTCPCCGNQIAFAVCVCEKIHCIGDEQISTCPWCNNQGSYGYGEGGFDVNRTQG
ncbi:TerY-C metal binding domain-containing protein [Flavobacterium tyrosinilyticum]|uniref:TerY-C metal binding domain-containing protein n=1 Tax=Flavobacterium tyrosinilyticum TaxID=1658740 RepID=UPI002030DD8F|nr:TerY-C metal binding domain-containing protein [Flavobacterium tyrosinilyticum]MCM0664582.1 VWA domain-containing protein [Flavobacterium tyrosinilyticum]